MTTATPRKPVIKKAPDLTSFAREGEALHVRNTLSSIAVFVARVDGNEEQSEFAAKGDPQGNDVMEVPSSYLKNPQFRKQLQRGIFEIVGADDPAVIDAYHAQKNAWEATQAAKAEADRFVDSQQPRAYSGTQCLAQEGRSQCSEFAISSSANANRERPALCQKHAHLTTQFTPEETGKFVDGKPEVRWIRVSIQER